MHDTAFAIGSKFLELYAGGPSKVVVELGAYAVNGSLRASCPPNACYIGLDLEHGPSVDVVVKAREPLPIRTGFADVVISSSQMEHDPLFWQSFLELVRITKPGGAIYMSAPSNGFYHTYPADCWRFYPDAGKALADWARTSGYDISLIESFTAERQGDLWNDFVCVYRVGADAGTADVPLLSDLFACTNVWTGRSSEIRKRRDPPEDVVIAARWRQEANDLRAELEQAKSEIARQAEQMTSLEATIAGLRTTEPAATSRRSSNVGARRRMS